MVFRVFCVVAVALALSTALACEQPTGTPCGDAYQDGVNRGPRNCVKVNGKNVVTVTYCPLMALFDAARADGITMSLSSGFRTYAEQQYFFDCMNSGKCNGGNRAAAPGHSNHQNGIAFDLDVGSFSDRRYKWLLDNAAKYGFVRAVRDENWHWEYHPGYKCDGIIKTSCYTKWCKTGGTFNYSRTCKNADGTPGANGSNSSPSQPTSSKPGVGQACSSGGRNGVCSRSCPTRSSVSGACGGGADVRCCLDVGCTSPAGASGKCVVASTCRGELFGNRCPGDSSVKCCVNRA